ncbi:MAG TPA: hypothetical protein VFO16_01430 [Pseudonocardiaceae bacterium]|nr:hypothetical protein [Pseudonocardiaceae bacterium]
MSSPVGAVVPPVLPQRGHPGQGACIGTVHSRHPLPLAALRARRTSSAVYGLAALDCHGRVADRLITQTLGWSAGLRLRMREAATGALAAAADPEGAYRITDHQPGSCPYPRAVAAPLRAACGGSGVAGG